MIKELKTNDLKENALVKADTFITSVGQLNNTPSGLAMTWLGVEIIFLLFVSLIAALVDAPTWSTI